MAQSIVQIPMDENLKHSMEAVCQELGMSLTTAFTMFAKKVSYEHRIPFDEGFDPFYSQSNQKAIQRGLEQIKNGEVVIKTIEELEAMEHG